VTSRFVDRDVGSSERSLFAMLVGDGRPLLSLVAVGLAASGAFAFFLSAAGELLPHDVAYLGMSAADLRVFDEGRVLDFMFHDRVAFGGTLVAVGVLYLWLISGPLAAGERWAWWLLAGSGVFGFASFLAYLGYGYLDSWHALATVALLAPFVGGLWRTRLTRHPAEPTTKVARTAWPLRPASAAGVGRLLLLLTGGGMVVAGVTILTIGTAVVFVPQDLVFIGLDRGQLDALNVHLVPLIAHDRAGFGGGLATTGMVVVGTAWFASPSKSLWQALLIAGSAGFGAAVGIHALVGYTDLSHVGPAIVGAALFGLAMALYPRCSGRVGPTVELSTTVAASRPSDRSAVDGPLPWRAATETPSRLA
jgi:hypothetical protein